MWRVGHRLCRSERVIGANRQLLQAPSRRHGLLTLLNFAYLPQDECDMTSLSGTPFYLFCHFMRNLYVADCSRDPRSNPARTCTPEDLCLEHNVLLHEPTVITAFDGHRVIPMTVLEELDHIKDRRDKSVSREARIAIQLIDKIVGSASPQEIQKGVEIPGSISMRTGLAPSHLRQELIADDAEVPFLNTNEDHANDNRIINVALRLAPTALVRLFASSPTSTCASRPRLGPPTRRRLSSRPCAR